MNRIMKIFRSRFFLAALCIIFEFAQLIAVFVLLYEFFLPFAVVCWIFHVCILLYVLNRDEIPELKIPWLIILCLVPVIGAYIFMLLSSHSTSKKDFDKADTANKEAAQFLKRPELYADLSEDTDARLQANYLCRITGMSCFGGTKTEYFPLGEDFHRSLLADLAKAEKYIFMEYFIIQEGKMWNPIHDILKEKAANGVKIYVMYDDLGCIAMLPEHYDKQLRSEGICCIPSNKFKPVLSHIHNNRDHRKITVIDGKIGYTGGINLADEYINAYVKHGHWKDTAVRLEGDGVRNLAVLFLGNWNAQSKEHIYCGEFFEDCISDENASGAVIPFGSGPEPIYKQKIGKNVYLNMINGAKEYLYITTPYLICDNELMNALCRAAEKGVDVRMITPHIADKKSIFLMTRSSYQKLLNSGVKIYEYTPGFIHAKNFICDDKLAVCGTINLDYRSLVHHFECGAWMYKTDCIPDMKSDFEETMVKSEEITNGDALIQWWLRLPAEIMKVLSPLL